MSNTLHLWEVKHSYYCTGQNFFADRDHKTVFCYESWLDFLETFGHESDMDYNFLFRWDWRESGETECDLKEYGEPYRDDYPSFRNGRLSLFFMMQRLGYHRQYIIEVNREDEDAVKEFLMPRMKHMVEMWEPLIWFVKE